MCPLRCYEGLCLLPPAPGPFQGLPGPEQLLLSAGAWLPVASDCLAGMGALRDKAPASCLNRMVPVPGPLWIQVGTRLHPKPHSCFSLFPALTSSFFPRVYPNALYTYGSHLGSASVPAWDIYSEPFWFFQLLGGRGCGSAFLATPEGQTPHESSMEPRWCRYQLGSGCTYLYTDYQNKAVDDVSASMVRRVAHQVVT